jgi:sugar phosphate permease
MQAGPPPKPSRPDSQARSREVVFVLACAASWLLYLHRYAWGVIKPAFLEQNPSISSVEIGWLDSAFMLTYALGQVPGGLAGDVFGPRTVLSVILVGWSLALAAVGWTSGFWRLFGVRSLFGVTQAAAYPVLTQMTRTWFPLAARTSVQGIVAAMGRIGAACSPVIVATVLMAYFGLSWQDALMVLAVPGLVLAAVCWLVVRERPPEAEKKPEREPGQRPALYLNRASVFSLAMLLVYAFASTLQDQFYVYWLPLFLEKGRGLSRAETGLFAPLPLLGGAVGGILGGVLNDLLLRWTGNRRWARSSVGFTGKFVAAGLVFLSIQVEDGRVVMVVLLLARIFGDWSLPTQWGAVTDMGGRAAGTLFGLINMVGAVGGFVGGPVLGFLMDHYGWEGLFLGVVAMCLLSACTWLFIDCTRRVVAD